METIHSPNNPINTNININTNNNNNNINSNNINNLNADNNENILDIEELQFQEIQEDKKKLTTSKFKNFKHNLEKLNYCTQNIEWDIVSKNREEFIYHCEVHQQGHRNNPEMSIEEINEKNKFKKEIKSDIFYTFSAFHSNIEPIYNHFQLRRNLFFISEFEIVYFNPYGIEMLNIITNVPTQLIHFVPINNENNEILIISFDAFKINTNTNSNSEFEILFVFGKFNNRIILQKIKVTFDKNKNRQNRQNQNSLNKYIVENIFTKEIIISNLEEQNQLVNHVAFSKDRKYVYTCCNDTYIKIFDLNTFKEVNSYKTPNCVNHLSYNSSNNIIAVVGDFEEVILIDPKSKEIINKLKGHFDFGFSAKFQKNSDFLLASSNQDYSAKIWDLRKLKDNNSGICFNKFDNFYYNFTDKDIFKDKDKENDKDINIINNDGKINDINGPCLKTYFGVSNAIGDLMFIQNEFLVLMENTYNLHIVNMRDDSMQTIKYVGNSTGFDFHEGMEKIYFGLYQYNYSGIYSYKKIDSSVDLKFC
jgi:WD40 repeat protein